MKKIKVDRKASQYKKPAITEKKLKLKVWTMGY